MASFRSALCLVLASALPGALGAKQWCVRGDACWPTADDVAALEAALDPGARALKYDGQGNPRPCAVPIGSPGDQPLYGFGATSAGLKALYENETLGDGTSCMHTGEKRDVCVAATRNNPLSPNSPQFVVFALTAADVQAAVRFAAKHSLCLAVAGTGHDFMNRHSCPGGVASLFLRTTLLKGIEWDLDDRRGLGAGAGGSVRVGAGHTFSELAQEATAHGRILSQGWGITVGVAGWSLGGGHGPFANALGLGVDNILEAEVVTADGTLVVANASDPAHAELLWALKGGGGSAWGVLTALTLRAHAAPAGGVTVAQYAWASTFCERRTAGGALNASVDALLAWQLSLPASISGLVFLSPTSTDVVPGGMFPGRPTCGGVWQISTVYNYLGAATDAACVKASADLEAIVAPMLANEDAITTFANTTTYASQWERAVSYPLEPITPVPWLAPVAGYSVGGVPSVLASRAACTAAAPGGDGGGGGGSAMGNVMKERLYDCARDNTTDPLFRCSTFQLYQAITGNVGAAQPVDTSVSAGLRSALLHVVADSWADARMDDFYAIGQNSYLSESAYLMGKEQGEWKQRLWGDNYAKLLAIKRKRDPSGVFWCRHCIGDEE
jgi:ribonuclease T2